MPRGRRRASPAGQGGGRGGAPSGRTGGGGGGRGGRRGTRRAEASDEGSSGGRTADGQGAAATGHRGTAAVVRRGFVIGGILVLAVVLARAWWSEPATATDSGARAWNATAVQRWFEEHNGGQWEKYAGKFEELNGEQMSELEKEDFVRRVPDNGDVIYNDWRATCCAAGWADALLSPGGAALALVVAAGVVLMAVRWFSSPPHQDYQPHEDITALLRTLEAKPMREGDAQYLQLRGFVDMWNVFSPVDTRVFLRPCYPLLLEELRRRTADLEWITNKPRQLILGTPGTGKSYFRLVLARDVLFGEESAGRPVHVVLVKCCDPAKADTDVDRNGVVLSRRAGGSLIGARVGRAQINDWCTSKVSARERVVVINDVSHGVQDLVISDGRVEVYTTSSNNSRVEDTHEANKREKYATVRGGDSGRRRVAAIETATMPLWSVEEALACRAVVAPHLSEDVVEANMLKYGMTARDAFRDGGDDGDDELRGRLARAAMLRSTTALAELLQSDDLSWHRLAQDRLFQRETDYDRRFVAADDGGVQFRQVAVDWRSNYVRDFVVAHCVARAAATVRQAVADPGSARGVVGSFVEGTYLQLIRAPRGSELAPRYSFKRIGPSRSRDLADLDADVFASINVRPQAVWFATGKEGAALDSVAPTLDDGAAVVLQPYDTRYPAIDATLVMSHHGQLYFVLLQATIAAQHTTDPVAAETLQLWVDLAGGRHDAHFGLVFVLPPGRYVNYNEQVVDHDVGDHVTQYALCVTEAGLD